MKTAAATMLLAMSGLRHRRGRTAMCIVGVAAGVALAVAVRVQTTSPTLSQGPTQRALVGLTTVQAVARGPAGMPVAAYHAVQRLPSVDAVAPVSVQSVAITGPRGRSSVLLVGVDRRLEQIGISIGSAASRELQASDVGLYLPTGLARKLGLRPGDDVMVSGADGVKQTLLSRTLARLGDQDIASAPIAVAPLGLAQTLTGQTGRISRLLILESTRSAADRVALAAAVGGGADLRDPDWETGLIAQATRLYGVAAGLFAVLCLLLGVIVVYAVTLLAAVDGRRAIATLAALGCAPARLVGVLICEAVLVGATGGAAGTLLGWWLVHALGSSPADQLSFTFIIPDDLRLGVGTAAAGLLGGIAISIAATLAANASLVTEPPAAALAAPAEPLRSVRWTWLAGAAGASAIVIAVIVTQLAPGLGVLSVCLVAGGSVLLVPGLLALLVGAVERVLPRPGGAGSLGVSEFACAPTRGSAMAAVVAVMVIGIIVVQSSNRNLQRGADMLANAALYSADLWATAAGNDAFLSRPMTPRARELIVDQSGVAGVRTHRTVFMDWQERRVMVLSLDTDRGGVRFTADVQRMLPGTGVQPALREGTAVLISRELARKHAVALGDRVTIPTPSGQRTLPIVGYVSNYGWQPGVIQLSSGAIERWWREPSLTALQIDVHAGADLPAVRERLQRVTAPLGLEIDPPALLRQRVRDTTRAGLAPLRNISWLLALGGVLALIASLVAAIMQRARRVATLQAIGIKRRQLLVSLTVEFAAATCAGVLAGLAGGLAAHRLALGYLADVTGIPVAYVIEPATLGAAMALATAAALAVPLLSLSWLSRIPVRSSFADV